MACIVKTLILITIFAKISNCAEVHPGQCPKVNNSEPGNCPILCIDDASCQPSEKCCPNSCGSQNCVTPVNENAGVTTPKIKENVVVTTPEIKENEDVTTPKVKENVVATTPKIKENVDVTTSEVKEYVGVTTQEVKENAGVTHEENCSCKGSTYHYIFTQIFNHWNIPTKEVKEIVDGTTEAVKAVTYTSTTRGAKEGQCPVLQTTTTACIFMRTYAECYGDSECPGNQKCCSGFCGYASTKCVDPVFPVTVKPGKCREYSVYFNVNIPNQCTDDSDCKDNMKCCKTLCGAKMCTIPI
jgi:hypothetical protein